MLCSGDETAADQSHKYARVIEVHKGLDVGFPAEFRYA